MSAAGRIQSKAKDEQYKIGVKDMIRLIKLVLVAFISLQALFYGLQNLVNLSEAHQFVAYVLGNQEHVAYPSSFGPSISNTFLIWIALIIILIGEFSAGLCAAKGAFDMWVNRKAESNQFVAAQKFAVLGCGLTMVVWFGLFMVIGGAFFQMWQTELGNASFNGSFQYFVSGALVLLILQIRDD